MKNRTTTTLPQGYVETEKIDLKANRKDAARVNVLSVVLALAVLVLGWLVKPMDIRHWQWSTWLLLSGAIFAYIIGHEAVHGVFMWRFSRVKPSFGCSLQYAYASSEAYFSRQPYLVIALAPLVVWGVLLGALAFAFPTAFWPVWLLQVFNVSGAAGDLYVFARIFRKPHTVLVRDTGTDMTIYECK